MPVSPKSLRLWVFPGDDISTPDVEAMLGELASSEFGPPLIELYAGKRYLEVTGWDRSQKVEKPYYQFPDRNGVIRPDWRGRVDRSRRLTRSLPWWHMNKLSVRRTALPIPQHPGHA
jgi:hypothetical protein